MRFFFTELLATSAAFLLLAALLIGSGAFFAAHLRFPGFEAAGLRRRVGLSLLVAVAAMPILLDIAGRLGPLAMAICLCGAAVMGAPQLMRGATAEEPLDRRVVGVAAVWLVIGALMLVEWPSPAGLVRSMLMTDYVKHAATTWAIAEGGTPPFNPSLYQADHPAAYYYFFYALTGAATVLGSTMGLAARHLCYAAALLAPFALYTLLEALYRLSRAGETVGAPPGAGKIWTVALVATTGLDVIPYFILLATIGYYAPEPEWWNEQVTSWIATSLWTPHHFAAVCAAYVGFIALADDTARHRPRAIALATLAFASMAGQSIYVAIAGAAIAAVWMTSLVWRGRLAIALSLTAAGVGALVLATPWLMTLTGQLGVGASGAPLIFSLRVAPWFSFVCAQGAACTIIGFFSMLVFYGIEFGVFGLGAWLFWRRAGRAGLANETARILAIGVVVVFVLGSFVRSNVLLNDFGWRIMLFAQTAAAVWTLAVARAGAFDTGRVRAIALGGLAFGYAMVALQFFQMRVEPIQTDVQQATLSEEIDAWRWLNARLPSLALVQERPRNGRAHSYGLYGRFPSYVSDRMNALLYGARRPLIAERMAQMTPVFEDPALTLSDVRAIARRTGVSAFVVTANDPIFSAAHGWAATAAPDYQTPRVRVFLFSPPERSP